jgi:hypothetical protein
MLRFSCGEVRSCTLDEGDYSLSLVAATRSAVPLCSYQGTDNMGSLRCNTGDALVCLVKETRRLRQKYVDGYRLEEGSGTVLLCERQGGAVYSRT